MWKTLGGFFGSNQPISAHFTAVNSSDQLQRKRSSIFQEAPIDRMIHCGTMILDLETQLYRNLLITSGLYRQQHEMYDEAKCHINNRIVNPSKPHVRPIIRGKAGKKTEFGAKISISDDNRFVEVDRISWNNYNQVNDLFELAKRYKQESGYYPARICADAIYMTVENKKFCREHGSDSVAAHARRKLEIS